MVKNSPSRQETQVQSLGQEDPLEKGMATHSSILAQEISRTEEPGGLQSMGSQKSGIQLSDYTTAHSTNRAWAISEGKSGLEMQCG